MPEVFVDVQNLSFSYPDGGKALKNINFKVNKGEIVAVLGANGAGKTTLCHQLTGIIPNIFEGTSEGKVIVAGINVADHPVYELAEKISFVTQDPEGQLINPDVLMEVAFGPENLGVPRDEIMRRAKWALESVGLQGLESRSPSELSGGQKQRLVLAAGLSMEPQLLVLDEPTSQLDPIGSAEVLDSLVHLKQRYEMTTILTTHATEEVLRIADCTIVLSKGEMVAEGDPRQVFNKVKLLDSVGVQVPQMAMLGYKVSPEKPVPMTIDEGKKLVTDILQSKHFKPNAVQRQPSDSQIREVVLECVDLSYIYPGFPPVEALKNVNLKISRGEMVGIIGQNGSGKTTLVKQFLKLLKPTKGQVLFNGNDIHALTTGQLATSIGLALQNPDEQLFTISCRKEVEFGLRNLKLPEEEIKTRVDEALGFVGLQEQWDTFPFRLSFGDRRSLTVAAVIAMRPEVIVMDEPTTAQDYLGRHRIARLGKKLNEKGHTVIMITHDMNLVTQYADRTIVMANGSILLDGPTRKVFSEEDALKKAFIKPPPVAILDKELQPTGIPQGILTVDEMVNVLAEAA
ncbi:MAG TPA: energy-coupling factor transporter ATPase [Candidatus Dormibacteraeota bacterium]|nr:energy-coupling factor transporter ATPase [Candidatus Dormibacteraeota bacterium]